MRRTRSRLTEKTEDAAPTTRKKMKPTPIFTPKNCQDENLMMVKVEVKDEIEETGLRQDEGRIEQEFSPQISTEPKDTIVSNLKTEDNEEICVKIEEVISLQVSPDPGETIARNVRKEEEEVFVRNKQGISPKGNPDPGDTTARNVKTEGEEILLQFSPDSSTGASLFTDPGDSIARNSNTREDVGFVKIEDEEIAEEIDTVLAMPSGSLSCDRRFTKSNKKPPQERVPKTRVSSRITPAQRRFVVRTMLTRRYDFMPSLYNKRCAINALVENMARQYGVVHTITKIQHLWCDLKRRKMHVIRAAFRHYFPNESYIWHRVKPTHQRAARKVPRPPPTSSSPSSEPQQQVVQPQQVEEEPGDQLVSMPEVAVHVMDEEQEVHVNSTAASPAVATDEVRTSPNQVDQPQIPTLRQMWAMLQELLRIVAVLQAHRPDPAA